MQFERAIQVLCDGGVEFVVIGGVSAAFHGRSQIIYDLDVCFSRTFENLRRLAATLAPFHPQPSGLPAGLPFVWDDVTLRNGTVFTLQTDLGELDLLAEVGSYEEVKARSLVVEAFGRRVFTLDLPSLIQAKRAAGREKDLAAVAELESLLEAKDP